MYINQRVKFLPQAKILTLKICFSDCYSEDFIKVYGNVVKTGTVQILDISTSGFWIFPRSDLVLLTVKFLLFRFKLKVSLRIPTFYSHQVGRNSKATSLENPSTTLHGDSIS